MQCTLSNCPDLLSSLIICILYFLWRALATAWLCIDPIIDPVVPCDELHTLYQTHIIFQHDFEMQL